MPEFGGEGLEQLHDQISQLSERQAANARRLSDLPKVLSVSVGEPG